MMKKYFQNLFFIFIKLLSGKLCLQQLPTVFFFTPFLLKGQVCGKKTVYLLFIFFSISSMYGNYAHANHTTASLWRLDDGAHDVLCSTVSHLVSDNSVTHHIKTDLSLSADNGIYPDAGFPPRTGVLAVAYGLTWIAGSPSTVLDPTDHTFQSIAAVANPIVRVSTLGQWDVVDTAASSVGQIITISIPAVDGVGFTNASALRLVGWNGTQWINLGIKGASGFPAVAHKASFQKRE
jgi:hypothetical protein